MGNIQSGFQIQADPIDLALLDRAEARRVLIVGAGQRCANDSNQGHQPHPPHAVTLDLPPNRTINYQQPSVHGDITDPPSLLQVLPSRGFDFIHFENVDDNVCTNAGAMASAHALLSPGGTLLIETGGVRANQTVAQIQRLLELLGFTNIFAKTTNGVQIVAMRGGDHSNVRVNLQ